MKRIDDYIASLPEWQAKNLATFRAIVHDIAPTITEDWKWNTPFYLLNGRILFGTGTFKAHTKYNFLNGALLDDTDKLFNNGFDSQNSRGIDLKEKESIDERQLRALIIESIQLTK